jgi:hypothetical protein
MHQANIRAIGQQAVETLGKQHCAIIDTSTYSQMMLFGGLGMNIGTIQWHIPTQPQKQLLLQEPTVDTILSFINKFDINSHIQVTSETIQRQNQIIFEATYDNSSQDHTIKCAKDGTTCFSQAHPHAWVEMIGTCLSLELARKQWIKYDEFEQVKEQAQYSHNVFGTDVTHIEKPARKNVTVIGAGGIGMYVGLLYDAPCNMTIIDPDICEMTNLNRQLVYTKNIGKAKVDVLCQVLQDIYPQNSYNAVCEKVTTQSQLEQHRPDIIISATDNLESRLLISEFCEQTKTRHIDGGCSLYTASVYEYVPNKTNPIHKQRSIRKQLQLPIEQPKKNSCATKINPSLFIPNAMSAALIVGCSYDKVDSQNNIITLNSSLHYSSIDCSIYKMT